MGRTFSQAGPEDGLNGSDKLNYFAEREQIRNEAVKLTHQLVPSCGLWAGSMGEKWNVCSCGCSADTGPAGGALPWGEKAEVEGEVWWGPASLAMVTLLPRQEISCFGISGLGAESLCVNKFCPQL